MYIVHTYSLRHISSAVKQYSDSHPQQNITHVPPLHHGVERGSKTKENNVPNEEIVLMTEDINDQLICNQSFFNVIFHFPLFDFYGFILIVYNRLLLVVSLHQSDPLSDTLFCDSVVNHEIIKRACLSQQHISYRISQQYIWDIFTYIYLLKFCRINLFHFS